MTGCTKYDLRLITSIKSRPLIESTKTRGSILFFFFSTSKFLVKGEIDKIVQNFARNLIHVCTTQF